MTTIEIVELFHLLFLDQLGRKVDQNLYALKGGCNLRFFLNSIRYSQDIDFDVEIIRIETLQKTVNQILQSNTLNQITQARGFEVVTVSEPKQTETTQRWKIGIKSSQSDLPIHTKIEFSRRGIEKGVCVDPIEPMVAAKYQLRPFLISHYSSEIAYLQKVKALIHRTETQARDLFDLFHLISMHVHAPLDDLKTELQQGIDNASNISYNHFCSQVLSFLSLEDQSMYQNSELWDTMVLRVIEELENATA